MAPTHQSAWGSWGCLFLLSLPQPRSVGQKSEEAGSDALEEDRGLQTPGRGQPGSALGTGAGHGVGTRGHRAICVQDPQRLKGNIAVPGKNVQVGGREIGCGAGWEAAHLGGWGGHSTHPTAPQSTCYVPGTEPNLCVLEQGASKPHPECSFTFQILPGR